MENEKLTWDEMKAKCEEFYGKLRDILQETHEDVNNPNPTRCWSRTLIPNGTKNQLNYYGKPANSFRMSDHWNWFANLKRCGNPRHVQCRCSDLPKPKPRAAEDKPSKPVIGYCVAYYYKKWDVYKVVYGEKYDRKTRKWTWVESDPEEVANLALYAAN